MSILTLKTIEIMPFDCMHFGFIIVINLQIKIYCVNFNTFIIIVILYYY